MITLGMMFIALTVFATYLHWRGTLYRTRWLLWVFVFAVIGPVLANELGWVSAEVGRQPWIVHPPIEWTPDGDVVVGAAGVVEYDESQGLRTIDGVSPSVSSAQVFGSIVGFGFIYLCLFAVWLFVLDQKIRHGPESPSRGESCDSEGVLAAAATRTRHDDSMTGNGSPS
jgi:cytochrome d ubiquinol oxidase subunit I